jgi:hypothetical protein
MALLDVFRPIRDGETLAAFIDQHSERLGRGIVDDYLRARAGSSARQLFAAPKFLAARDQAQHEAYPVAVAMVGEMVASMLSDKSEEIAPELARGLGALATALFDRRVPLLAATAWSKARHEVSHSLAALETTHPKPVSAIAAEFASSFLALMPMHDKLSPDDFPALRNHIERELGEVHASLTRRASVRRLVAALTKGDSALADNPA